MFYYRNARVHQPDKNGLTKTHAMIVYGLSPLDHNGPQEIRSTDLNHFFFYTENLNIPAGEKLSSALNSVGVLIFIKEQSSGHIVISGC